MTHPWITRNFEDEIPLTYDDQINAEFLQERFVHIMKAIFYTSKVNNELINKIENPVDHSI